MTDKPRETGPHAVNDAGEYMEDIIMEHFLGRPLEPWEVPIHHNGDTLDNRRDNLTVMIFGTKG